MGRYEESVSEYKPGELCAILNDDSVQIAIIWVAKGIIQHRLENYRLALEYYQKGIEILEPYFKSLFGSTSISLRTLPSAL